MNNKHDCRISYPGITVENIPGTKKFYEVVLNCGGLSAAISALSQPEAKTESLKFVTKIFESVKQDHNQLIFITDNEIYQNEKNILNTLLTSIFGEHNFRVIGVEITSREKNPVSGLQMNRTGFSDEDELVRSIAEMPNATVLSSIPKSDPRIDSVNQRIGHLKNTIAGRSLQLLELNAHKRSQIDIAGESIGFLGYANNAEELENIFLEHGDKILVIKDDYGTAGGTSVNFVANKKQQQAILRNKDLNFPLLVNEFLHPTLITNEKGEQFPVQFRPFLGANNTFLGGTLKFPEMPIGKNMFSEGDGKTAFQKQNNTLNTSSGKTHSIFIDEKGNAPFGFTVAEKGFHVNGKESAEKFLSQFHFENQQKGVKLGEELLERTQIATPELQAVQKNVNTILNK